MSWIDRVRRRSDGLERIDVRLGLTLAGLYGPLVAVVLFALYAFAATELLELAELEVSEHLAQLEIALQDPSSSRSAIELALLTEQLKGDWGGYIVRDAAGRIVSSGGLAVRPDDIHPQAEGLLRAIRTRGDDYVTRHKALSEDRTIEVFVSSARFVKERDEIQRGFWITLALGIVLVVVVSIPATSRALLPLRRATRTAEAIDVGRLDGRLPHRGTDDDVDRHSVAINRLLDRIESGFTRIESFSHDVAHELRTPVNRLLNLTEIALLEPDRPALERPELQSIRDSAEQMARIVDNLLLLARSEEGRLSTRREKVHIDELCETLREMYEPACEEMGLTLEVSADRAAVLGDPALLMRTLANLLDNAMAHTPAGGSIRLETSCADCDRGWLALEVRDTGPGVPPADRERVFDRFVRAKGPRGEDGLGLGLAIARALARAHGGDVEIRESPGPGSSFVVTLPVA